MRNQYPSKRQFKKEFKKIEKLNSLSKTIIGTVGLISILKEAMINAQNSIASSQPYQNGVIIPSNIITRKLTSEELANRKPKGRFQLRYEEIKLQEEKAKARNTIVISSTDYEDYLKVLKEKGV